MGENNKTTLFTYLEMIISEVLVLAGRFCARKSRSLSLCEFLFHMVNLCVVIFFFLFFSLSAIAQPPPLSPAVQTPPPLQVRNIIDALIGAGDFTSWVTILSLANPLMLPMSTTLFVPQDGGDFISDNHPAMDPLLFPYHIVPQRLSFSDLLLFKTNTRIPTLLPAMSIVITNSSRFNFTLDNIPITHPNLYNTDSISVHGIAAVLDYSVFGYSFPLLPPPTTAGNQVSEFLPPPPSPSEGILKPPFMPIGDPSDSACSCTEAPIVFLIFCGVLAFKMQRIPYIRCPWFDS